MQSKPFVVALEEHYLDADLATAFLGRQPDRQSEIEKRLLDVGALRLREMDEAGIDLQVLSHGAPAAQGLAPETAVRLARQTNDRLHAIVQANPQRFAAFAILPTPDPQAAADELEYAVSTLGFKGAMIHGLTHGVFIDDRRFWPIFERAEALDVPLYMHPSYPNPVVIDAYYKDYADQYPELIGPALGFTVETATQGVRLVLSGVFQKYPGLRIVMGHLGEGIPFLLWRINESLSRPGNAASLLFPRCVPQAFLSDDQRQLLRHGAGLRDRGNGRGPHSVLGRLAVYRQRSRNEVAVERSAYGNGQSSDLRRQRKDTAEALAAKRGAASPISHIYQATAHRITPSRTLALRSLEEKTHARRIRHATPYSAMRTRDLFAIASISLM